MNYKKVYKEQIQENVDKVLNELETNDNFEKNMQKVVSFKKG